MKLLLYCVKAKPYLYRQDDDTFKLENKIVDEDISDYKKYYGLNNGKIVAECDFEVEEIGLVEIPDYAGDECHTFVYDVYINFETKTLNQDKLFKKSCLNWEEMEKYLYSTNGKGYAIHIKNLHIFDKPRELNEVYKIENIGGMLFTKPLTNTPQNMMRVSVNHWDYATYELNDINVLISIRPQWLCKILNGEKTIEVRKKVLKEMLG